MSIPVEGSYRNLISETLLQVRRRQAQVKGLAEELEAIVQAAAGIQKVNLKEFVLDVDTLEFTLRPTNVVSPNLVPQAPPPELVTEEPVYVPGTEPMLVDPVYEAYPVEG